VIYRWRIFPAMRRSADRLWEEGWRPEKLFFMMTTFRERRETTEKVLLSIIRESREVGVPTMLVVATAESREEEDITEFVGLHAHDLDLDVIIVRQNVPGKRVAMGLALRALSRAGDTRDNPVVFMDGDSVLAPGCLRKCLPLFALNPKLHALTTHEQALVLGPTWIQKWLDLRFAQRHLAMQSHSLSRKVLTLTGRMSVFRATYVTNRSFIRTVEADHIDHWLWGTFRFLSGDDKSTWYWLLRQGADMLYVPDALVYTIEVVPGNGVARMRENVMRWSGNMLRNGWRAIALGPRRVGWFIWWCLIDQRIAIWTVIAGPIAAAAASIAFTPAFILGYVIWIAFTRFLLSLVLFAYAGRVDPWFPLLLYANQMVTSIVKVYVLFRLPMQRWFHRGNQRSGFGGPRRQRLKLAMASYLTVLFVGILAYSVFVYVGVLALPDGMHFRFLLDAVR
jgi:glycosyltransferase Alg8